MATDTHEDINMPSPPTDPQDLVTLTITHHSKPLTLTLPPNATLTDLSDEIAHLLSIPASNQKFMISKLGLLKFPFPNPDLPISTILTHKITLLGSTSTEASSIAEAAAQVARRVRRHPAQKVQAYKTHDWKAEQESAQYTFLTLRPLPYLLNPSKSLEFLQRLKDDAGIKACMRKHKFSVPLLTEMNPIEHTQSNHEGTSRTLGLNRNAGEVIELRLRTDAYDGYRDYKTIRKTLCHELAHNVFGPHDRNFWELCKQIEREVEGVSEGGRVVGGGRGGEEEYYPGEDDVHDDEGGWTGGEFVLGAAGPGSNIGGQGMSRREILAKAAEERMKRARERESQGSERSGDGS